MKDFSNRQGQILLSLIVDFRIKRIDLNSFLRRVEGITDILDSPHWSRLEFPIFSTMEEINASIIDENRELSQEEEELIKHAVQSLEEAAKKILINSTPDD